jgi:gamma-glutamyltranspeptidase/glutathione hydrolase
MRTSPERFISDSYLDKSTSKISLTKAMDWPEVAKKGDTIWMGAVDSEGTVVSFIQSIFWEFGSGVICPETGVLFQNRGAGFSLSPGPNCLAPGKKPFHTLNPAMAVMSDGRIVSYGTMGGEGQPQTQAAIFARYAFHGVDLQRAISAPRWLLGKTWGDDTTSLKLESSFDAKLINELREANHQVEIVSENNSLMGHAGSVVSHPDGRVEAASDARSDGIALAG